MKNQEHALIKYHSDSDKTECLDRGTKEEMIEEAREYGVDGPQVVATHQLNDHRCDEGEILVEAIG